MKITIEYDPDSFKARTGFVVMGHWNVCSSRLKELKEWLNFFGFNVVNCVLNEDLTFTIQTEKLVPNSVLNSMIKDLCVFKLISID